MQLNAVPAALRLRRLARDRSGAALIEFALGMPLLLTAGLYGIELTNFALVNQRVSQIALQLADNASRVGLMSGQATVQLREADMNDVLQAVRLQGVDLGLATRGRITVSSLEHDGTNQRIHWQRCLGLKAGTGWDSSYGTTDTADGTSTAAADAGTLAPDGMGEEGAKVNAPENSGVMFVEINYEYEPLVGEGWFTSTRRIHHIASFVVRDRRDFSQIHNPAPAVTRATCNRYTS